jgi:hypothetical protein
MFDTYWYDYDNCKDINELIAKAIAASKTEYIWLCHRAVDYTNFNLRYNPSYHQNKMLHAWASHDNPQCFTTWLIPIKNSGEIYYHADILSIITPPIWNTSEQVLYDGFNFNWYPDVWDWGKQHHFAMYGTTQLSYTSIGNGDEIKYHISNLKFKGVGMLCNINDIDNSPYEWNWILDNRIDYSDFNFNWLPDSWDADKIHEFCMWGTEQLSYTKLLCKNCSNERVYHHSYLTFKNIPKLNEITPIDSEWVWIIDERIDYSNFNFNWLPDAWDINKTHAFAMHGTDQLCYTFLHNTKVPSNETKYHNAGLKFDPSIINDEWVWIKDERIDYSNFDFSWLPDAWDTNKTHAFTMFGTKQLAYTFLKNTKYKSTSIKYHKANLKFDPSVPNNEWVWQCNERIDYSNFDFNWLPDAWDTNKTHAFAMRGTEQLCYTFLHNTQVESVETKFHKTELRFKSDIENDEWVWIKDDRIDYSNFDFSWLPDSWDSDKTHVFCMAGTKHLGYTKLINTNITNPKTIYHVSELRFLPHVRPVIYWQDYSNAFNLETIKTLAMGNEWTWIADHRINYSEWNFEWLPDGWDTNYIHAFTMDGKEQLSYTVLVHRDAIDNFIDYKYHISTLQFTDIHADMCFLNTNTFDNPLTADFQVRLITTMEEAIKAAVNKSRREWLWIYSDVCDYDDFDWNWLPDLDQRDQIHCWPSGTCEKGDTFLVHVPSFNNDKLKFNFNHAPLNRKRWPVITVTDNCLAWDLNNYPRNRGIYTVYSYTGFIDYPDVCLWEKRPVVSLNRSNSTCLVPRDCIVDKEIYEYPHLLRYPEYGSDIDIDVIFIHNKESCAEDNWNRLLTIHPNAKLISGINNRLEAYRAAAFQSNTPWFIAVFAKCHVLDNFAELNWQPDFWQEPKHYIFYNQNLNTGLEYGHMAPIAYHCKLLYENKGGLDMTLAQRHTTVPVVISKTNLDDDWLTWRTAFREVIKILHYSSKNPSIENEYRLWAWRNVANGSSASMQKQAVKHAEEYYAACNGKIEALMLTSEWDWLYEHYNRVISQIGQL